METRARYALIGLFMLAVILSSFGFVYWLQNKGGFTQRTDYRVRFESPVSGLLVGSTVLFNGIRVGEVTSLKLDAAQPEAVIATIAVATGTPIRSDTKVGIESQGLAGGVALTLTGGSTGSPPPASEGGGSPVLVAEPGASADWTEAARKAFQHVDDVLSDNAKNLHDAIANIATFTDALARNSDKVDGILAGIEKLTGGGSDAKTVVPLYNLSAASGFTPPAEAPSWQLAIPEPTTLMGFNTDKILLQPVSGESVELADAKWNDNFPILFQARVLQSFENAGYAASVSRPREGATGGYQLLLDIRRFDISTASAATAEINFMAKIAGEDGRIVGAREFQSSVPAEGSDAKAYVAALDQGFGKLATELVGWTTTELANAPPPPETQEPPPTQESPPIETPEPPPGPDQQPAPDQQPGPDQQSGVPDQPTP
jgi:phospholipid/cholesterol/gamma-HCH transport system substrate-binding protein